jgi:hypothetical protein
MALRLATDRLWSSPAGKRPIIHLCMRRYLRSKEVASGGERSILFLHTASLLLLYILYLLFLFPPCQAVLLIKRIVCPWLEAELLVTQHILRGSNIHFAWTQGYDCISHSLTRIIPKLPHLRSVQARSLIHPPVAEIFILIRHNIFIVLLYLALSPPTFV